jgi:hypothetical protein
LAPSSDESNDCNHVAVHKWQQGYPPRDINAAPRWARARPRRSLDLGPTRDRDLARCSQFPRLIHRRRVAFWCAWEENEGRCVLWARGCVGHGETEMVAWLNDLSFVKVPHLCAHACMQRSASFNVCMHITAARECTTSVSSRTCTRSLSTSSQFGPLRNV